MNTHEYGKYLVKARSLGAQDPRAALELVCQICVTVFAFWAASRTSWIPWLVGEVLVFSVLWRWFSILHTTVHNSYFKNRDLNSATGVLASVFALLPYHSWRASHLSHHLWTGWYGLDPSLDFPRRDRAPASLRRVMDIAWRWHIPFFGFFFILGKLWGQVDSEPKAKDIGSAPSGVELFASCLAIAVAHGVLVFLMTPMGYLRALGIPIFAYLVTADIVILNQHSEFDLKQPDLSSRPQAPLLHLAHTRSVLFPEWVSRHVFLRFDWHELHHLYPGIPHYRLAPLKSEVPTMPNAVTFLKWMSRAQSVPGHELALPRIEHTHE